MSDTFKTIRDWRDVINSTSTSSSTSASTKETMTISLEDIRAMEQEMMNLKISEKEKYFNEHFSVYPDKTKDGVYWHNSRVKYDMYTSTPHTPLEFIKEAPFRDWPVKVAPKPALKPVVNVRKTWQEKVQADRGNNPNQLSLF